MTKSRSGRPGAATLALLAILAITAAWWALALWPAGAAEPEWLTRTRAACFGAPHGGLPDVGGWILLIGEPLGMLGVLLVVWRDRLRDDFRTVRAHRQWRLAAIAIATLAVAGFVSLGWRVARTSAFGSASRALAPGTPTRTELNVSSVTLTDQHGHRTSFAEFRGHTVLLTFAYGHCTTVCPMVVHDVLAARTAVNRPDVPLVVMTLDPWRDAPERLASLATQWALAPGDRMLSGSITEVARALDALGIGRRRDEATGDIEHGGTVMIVDARGHVTWRLDGGWGRLRELLAEQAAP